MLGGCWDCWLWSGAAAAVQARVALCPAPPQLPPATPHCTAGRHLPAPASTLLQGWHPLHAQLHPRGLRPAGGRLRHRQIRDGGTRHRSGAAGRDVRPAAAGAPGAGRGSGRAAAGAAATAAGAGGDGSCSSTGSCSRPWQRRRQAQVRLAAFLQAGHALQPLPPYVGLPAICSCCLHC